MIKYVVKHEPSGMFVSNSDEIGYFLVPNLEDSTFFDLESAEYLDFDMDVNTEDLTVYEVEIKLGNKI